MRTMTVPVPVGSLAGIRSFASAAGGPLLEFTRQYSAGLHPTAVWELSQLRYPHVSILELTTLLATAKRLAKFAGGPQEVILPKDPRVVDFLSKTGFLDLATRHNIFELPPSRALSSTRSTTSNTLFRAFGFDATIVQGERRMWRDPVRGVLTRQVLNDLLDIFDGVVTDFVMLCASTTAELILNSFEWGRTDSFVGLQRTRAGITVAVADAGQGFLHSFLQQPTKPQPRSHFEALLIASRINEQEMGLRDLIRSVMERNGRVMMSSYDATIVWRPKLWELVSNASPSDAAAAARLLRSEQADFNDTWSTGVVAEVGVPLRGARIGIDLVREGAARRG